MLKIPPKLHQELQAVLLNCGPFNTDASLHAHFAVEPLVLWQAQLPQAYTRQERVQATINLLARHETAQGENGLLIFLQLLRDGIDSRDECHVQVAALAREVSQLGQVAAAPTLGQRVRDFVWGESPEARNRQAMLNLVEETWIKGLLENSLQDALFLTLGLEQRPEAVITGRQWLLQVGQQTPRPLPAETSILSVFQQHHEALLILGEPGAGKTTTLLELARANLELARQDSYAPIPVVFNLSTWRGEPLVAWLTQAFVSFYQVSSKISRPWLEQGQLILLLDGLDEVASSYRAACVQAINQFRHDHFMPLAVCSRLADYEALTEKLQLQGAVRLQALSPQQIEQYLTATHSPQVRLALTQDAGLQELAQSPLLLSIMTLAYRELPAAELPQFSDPTARRHHLFDHYVAQMLTPRAGRAWQESRFGPEQLRQGLGYLARQMVAHGQSLFLLEQLQPSWLPTRGGYWFYMLASRLGTLWLWYLIFSLLVIMFGIKLEGRLPFLEELIAMLDTLFWLSVIGIVITIIDGLRHSCVVRYPYLRAKTNTWWYILLNILGVVGLVFTAIRIVYSLKNGSNIFDRMPLVALYSIPFSIFLGLRGRRQHFDLDIYPTERLYWSWYSFFKSYLSTAIVTGILSSFLTIVAQEQGLIDIITQALGLGLIVAFFGGWQSKIVDSKTTPNEGIWLSLKNGLFLNIINSLGVIVIARAITLGYIISSEPEKFLSQPFTEVYSFIINHDSVRLVISFAVLTSIGFLWFGGLDALQHYCLRVLLWGTGCTPWRYVAFLDAAVERVLLRQVGGGYIFVHRLLLEYFASLQKD